MTTAPWPRVVYTEYKGACWGCALVQAPDWLTVIPPTYSKTKEYTEAKVVVDVGGPCTKKIGS